jgi:hypothetical protein
MIYMASISQEGGTQVAENTGMRGVNFQSSKPPGANTEDTRHHLNDSSIGADSNPYLHISAHNHP